MKTQTAPMTLYDISKKVVPILQKHDVIHASVFGSFARGDATEDSDVDILVEFQEGLKKSLLDLVELKQQMEDNTGKAVDIVTRKGLDQKITKYVHKNIVQIL